MEFAVNIAELWFQLQCRTFHYLAVLVFWKTISLTYFAGLHQKRKNSNAASVTGRHVLCVRCGDAEKIKWQATKQMPVVETLASPWFNCQDSWTPKKRITVDCRRKGSAVRWSSLRVVQGWEKYTPWLKKYRCVNDCPRYLNVQRHLEWE